MMNWDFSQEIADGFERGMEKIGDKVADACMAIANNVGLALLDGAGTLIIILAMYYIFKFMLNFKKGKQEENVNMLVCLGGIYFIVKMFAVMIELGAM
jgi:hypothetical protein